jgi:hypothetical protein
VVGKFNTTYCHGEKKFEYVAMNLEHFMRDALDNVMTCSLQVHDSSISWNLEVDTQA